ncbi:MAG: IPT/TIG domain-containing protein [Dehalococcoidia bacterium]
MNRDRGWYRLVCVALSLILVSTVIMSVSCGGGSEDAEGAPTTSPGTIANTTPEGETPKAAPSDILLDKSTVTLDQNGGKVKLKDGTELTVPAGALSGTATVELKELDNPQDFGAGAVAYELTGLTGAISATTLTFPIEKGLSAEEIDVFSYDIEKGKAAEIPYTYDPAGRLVTVTIDQAKMVGSAMIGTGEPALRGVFPDAKMAISPSTPLTLVPHRAGIMERIRILFIPEKAYVPKDSEHIISMPYYQQAGGSCWAADTLMLMRGYGSAEPRDILGKVLHGGGGWASALSGTSDTDFGLTVLGLQSTLLPYIANKLNADAEWHGYLEMQHLRWRLLRELDSGHPLILKLTGLGHYVLVIGYRNSGNEFVLHDSKSTSPPDNLDGGMYCIRPFSWIKEQKGSFTNAVQVLWVNNKLSSGNTLQTIGCPGADESGASSYGECYFYSRNPRNQRIVPMATLQFLPSRYSGYQWQNVDEEIKVIPSEAENFLLKFPLWNADRRGATATIEINIYTGTEKVFSWSDNVSLPSASDNTTTSVNVEKDIPLGDIRRVDLSTREGTQKVDIDVQLKEGNTYRDGFSLEAVLSVLPYIKELDPKSAAPGAEVKIKGSSFGKNKSFYSKVTVGKNLKAEIVSWADNQITIRVPEKAAEGPIVVATGEGYRYLSNPADFTAPLENKTVTGAINWKSSFEKMGLKASGSWSLDGARAVVLRGSSPALVEGSPVSISLTVAKGAPCRLNVDARAVLDSLTAREDGPDGAYWIVKYREPKLVPSDRALAKNGDFPCQPSPSGLGVDFTFTGDDQSLSFDVAFEAYAKVEAYESSKRSSCGPGGDEECPGILISETENSLENTYIAAIIHIEPE